MLKDKIERILPLVQKPARYFGGELNAVVKDKKSVNVRFAFCFPDTYEIGMSHLGMKILYGLLNQREDIWCERVFAPWFDMKEQMIKEKIPLYALESLDPLTEFDIIGFTLQYELSYTNVLYMLDLAGIPLRASDRQGLVNLVIGGGPCVCNPEPIAEFFDLFVLGEGEEVILELCDLYKQEKARGSSKQDFLRRAAQIDGIYVPAFYDVTYQEDGTVKQIIPTEESAKPVVTKRILSDFDRAYFPKEFVVPFIETVHDRAILEVMRGCIRGCRFCQAGFIYRPLRERSKQLLCEQGKSLCERTGYEEISLSSLSTSDYTEIEELLTEMMDWSNDQKVNLSLPSLRVDNFSQELLDKITAVRKSGLTFAPEAGTQRLRDVINKNVSDSEIETTCTIAFEGGFTNVKLYFMIGLPTETQEDVRGILETAQRVVDLFYRLPNRPKGKGVTVSVSVSSFVPKAHTPFQWEAQDTMQQLKEKHDLLLSTPRSKKITLHYHEVKTSFLEGVFARGDRRLSQVILKAYQSGCYFDGWGESFDLDKWMSAFETCGIRPEFYANRQREFTEVLPWSHLDFGVSQAFLIRESQKAHAGIQTPNCRQNCSACGAAKLMGGDCVAKH